MLVSIPFNLNRLNCITPTTRNYRGNTGSFYSQAKKGTLKEKPPWNWPYTCIASLIPPQKKMQRTYTPRKTNMTMENPTIWVDVCMYLLYIYIYTEKWWIFLVVLLDSCNTAIKSPGPPPAPSGIILISKLQIADTRHRIYQGQGDRCPLLRGGRQGMNQDVAEGPWKSWLAVCAYGSATRKWSCFSISCNLQAGQL